ncbi:ATP-binding protein [Streptomyces sp. SCSIO 30461]|uniref:ATP-binding protein n=1 Tax=Streptomyces sp. SCSIO 30461 TaxID=3118085 RepID=UPI0030CE21A8
MSAHRGVGDTPYVVWRWVRSTPNAPAQARIALRCALVELRLDDEAITDAVLAVSELVTNATRYATGPYEMRLRRIAEEIFCEVEDHDPRIPDIPTFPVAAPYAPNSESRGGGLDALCAVLSERGRGLHIVHELSNGFWGFRGGERTKTAWFAVSASTQ